MQLDSAFASDDSVSLASWLLDEISRGLMPVWPSTPRNALRIVRGLEVLHDTRPAEVEQAMSTAPAHGVLDWNILLASVGRMAVG